jgi:transmembrane sensor
MKIPQQNMEEASVWLARLRSPERTSQFEQGFRRWLAESQLNARAFEQVTDAWELAGRLPRKPFPPLTHAQRPQRLFQLIPLALSVAAVLLVSVLAVFYFRDTRTISTTLGEQRILSLEDGTKVHLNTDSKIVLSYTSIKRRVILLQGEAFFEVAQQRAPWPFVVESADKSVVALGTAFVVKNIDEQLSIALLEGKVAIQRERFALEPIALQPGQRIVFKANAVPLVDRPRLDSLVAWRYGYVEFHDATLQEAIDEMNRYSLRKVMLADGHAASLPINGVFRTGDSLSFALAVAKAHSFKLQPKEAHLVLRFN